MADDLTKRGPQDRSKINVHEPWELAYWTKDLGVSAATLKQVVADVGPSVAAVRKKLGK
jgi:hypothetical protein